MANSVFLPNPSTHDTSFVIVSTRSAFVELVRGASPKSKTNIVWGAYSWSPKEGLTQSVTMAGWEFSCAGRTRKVVSSDPLYIACNAL